MNKGERYNELRLALPTYDPALPGNHGATIERHIMAMGDELGIPHEWSLNLSMPLDEIRAIVAELGASGS